jgi:hypothetical protein
MATGLVFKTLILAVVAAGIVWLLTVATFRPDAYVDNRPFCSNSVTLPDGPSGVGLPTKTFPPGCHGGPIPADALAPPPVPAVVTFIFAGSLRYIVGVRRA